ncbi:MAG: hypothetical protein JST12_16885 [Armatimonadetes bacterium]|nr:hypothetical protein [Armatimonadota bacterium]
MISTLLTLGILSFQSPIGYDFPVDSVTKFSVKVQFDGFIPLFGGRNGKADVDMVVQATSVAEKVPSLQAVNSEIVEMSATAFGAKLPLNKNNIGEFFPSAVATFDRTGLVKTNGAGKVDMPVKLPGLDSTKLPEISYLPVVLNPLAISSRTAYSFDRTFNDVPMHYKVTPGAVKDGKQDFDIEIEQKTAGFEDLYGNPVVEEAAKVKLTTDLKGTGKATFDLAKRMFDKVAMETNAATEATTIKTGKTTNRNLKTTLTIVRQDAKVNL